MRAVPALLLAAVLLLPPGAARAAWEVDAQGNCVERWTAADLLRGPSAMLGGLLRPFRNMAGGAEYAWNEESWWPWQIAGLGPAVVVVSGAAGALEGVWWIGSGLVDTLTGGAFAVAPQQATEIGISPQLSSMIADQGTAPAPATDPCGRPKG